MRTVLKAVTVLVVLASALSLAEPPQGEVVIRTRKGKMVMGRILSETSKGYLVSGPDGTSVVEFASITDIRQLAPTAPIAEAAPTPPPPVVVVAPAPVAPPPAAPAPSVVNPNEPPPPPVRPPEPSVNEVIASAQERRGKREGFHFGLGAGGLYLPDGPLAQLEAHFEINFGRIAYRGVFGAGVMRNFFTGYFPITVDNLFQVHFGDFFALGAGVKLGVAASFISHVYVAPVIQPAIVTLGDRGQHQLSLTASIAVLSTVDEIADWYSNSWVPVSFAGTPQAYVGYTYLF